MTSRNVTIVFCLHNFVLCLLFIYVLDVFDDLDVLNVFDNIVELSLFFLKCV